MFPFWKKDDRLISKNKLKKIYTRSLEVGWWIFILFLQKILLFVCFSKEKIFMWEDFWEYWLHWKFLKEKFRVAVIDVIVLGVPQCANVFAPYERSLVNQTKRSFQKYFTCALETLQKRLFAPLNLKTWQKKQKKRIEKYIFLNYLSSNLSPYYPLHFLDIKKKE